MSNPVPPIKLNSDSPTFKFAVTPDEKARAFFELTRDQANPAVLAAVFSAFNEAFVKRQPKNSKTFNALNTPLRLFVAELVYPGNAATQLVAGKFLYVVNRKAKQILVEFENKPPTPPFPSDPFANLAQVFLGFQPAVITLPISAPLNREDIGIFLSPVQLDADGKKDLATGAFRPDDNKDALFMTPEELFAGNWLAVVPDSREWAVDCNIQFFEPAHDDFDAFLSNPILSAELFIARSLQQLIKQPNSFNPVASNDPLGLRNELARQPEDYIAEYNGKKKPIEDLYDQAANYLGTTHLLPPYVLIEKCADRKGGLDKEQQFHATAVVTRKLSNHPIGLLSMQFIMGQSDRMVTKQLAIGLTPAFPAFRHTYLAILFIFGEFSPAWMRVRSAKAVKARIIEVHNLVRGIGVIAPSGAFDKLDEKSKEILEKVAKDQEKRMAPTQVLGKLPAGTKGSTLEKMTVDRLAIDAAVARLPVDAAKAHPKFTGRATPFLKAIPQLAALVIEGFNVVNNLQGVSDPTKSTFDKAVSLVGAGADAAIVSVNATIAIAKIFGIMQKEGSPLAMKWFRINPYLTWISAVADTIQFSSNALAAGRDGNTALAIGNWISAGGSAVIAVAATVQIGMAASTSFLATANSAFVFCGFGVETLAVAEGTMIVCPVVGWAVAAGTAFVIAGEVIIFLATRNSYENFASRSFLGNARDRPFKTKPSWAFTNMPVDDRIEEARNLLGLISNFKVSIDGNGDPLTPGSFIEIQPYYLEADSRISVQIEITAANFLGHSETFLASLAVYGAEGRTRQDPADTLIVNTDKPVAQLGDDDTIHKIRIPLTPGAVVSEFKTIGNSIPYASGVFLRTLKCLVRVRLEGNRTIVPPPATGSTKPPWCQLNTLDRSVILVEGLDEKARVNH